VSDYQSAFNDSNMEGITPAVKTEEAPKPKQESAVPDEWERLK